MNSCSDGAKYMEEDTASTQDFRHESLQMKDLVCRACIIISGIGIDFDEEANAA
jgi:hypothetical protein